MQHVRLHWNLADMEFRTLRGDVFGGVTAAVVALPLSLAFGVASGLGPIAGMYGAVAVGFLASVLGGTPAQVSGPTGPMTVVMASVVALYAQDLSTAFTIVCLGGAFQVVFGMLGVGRFVSYTPYSVISGFMSGIGAIIILLQLLPFLGAAAVTGGPLDALQALAGMANGVNLDALGTGAVVLAIMVFWPKKLGVYLPAPLAALAAGTALCSFVFPTAPVIGEVPVGMPTLQIPHVALDSITEIIQPAFVLALLGSIDSLLTSLVADSVTRTHHNSDRELMGQGIGNIAAGMLGALPGAGATMRTLVNIRAGGRTPVSGALHACILLSLLLGLAPLVSFIPHAALAGILIKVGWDIIDWGYLKRIRRAPRDKVIVMLVTLGLTVFVDLITAVAIGLIVAGFATARWMEQEELKGVTAVAISEDASLTEAEHKLLEHYTDQILFIEMRGRFSYASARELVKRLGSMAGKYRVIILDFSAAAHIDTSAAMAIREVVDAAVSGHAVCVAAGLAGVAEKTLDDLGVLEGLDAGNRVPDKAQAIERAVAMLAV